VLSANAVTVHGQSAARIRGFEPPTSWVRSRAPGL
jgi:hypothetical protein